MIAVSSASAVSSISQSISDEEIGRHQKDSGEILVCEDLRCSAPDDKKICLKENKNSLFTKKKSIA